MYVSVLVLFIIFVCFLCVHFCVVFVYVSKVVLFTFLFSSNFLVSSSSSERNTLISVSGASWGRGGGGGG